MTRYRAAFYHLLISLAIFSVIAWLIVFEWYPDFFYRIDGGWEGLRLIIFVDLVIGPLLTLIVYRAGKPGLLFDLSLIGLVQATCLAGGLYVVYNERPIFFIFYEGHFYSASAGSYLNYGVNPPDPSGYDDTPARVFSEMPVNPIEEANIRGIYYRARVPLWTAAEYYDRLERHMDTVMKAGWQRKDIEQRDPENNLDGWLARHGGAFEDYAFVPIRSRHHQAYLGIRRADKRIEGILEVNPPPVALPPKPLENAP